MGTPKGVHVGGRKKGVPNKSKVDLERKLHRLGCDPIEILAKIATRSMPCIVCMDEDGKHTGKMKFKVPAGSHVPPCSGDPCTCGSIGERPCEHCFGSGWERICIQDCGAAAGRLAKMIVPELKAVEVSGSLDLGLQQVAKEILEARRKRTQSTTI